MFFNNLKDNSEFLMALPPGTRKVTTTGAALSLKDGEQVCVAIAVGPWVDGSHAFSFLEAQDVAGAPGAFAITAVGNMDSGRDNPSPLDVNGVVNITDNTMNGKVIVLTYIGGAPWFQVKQTITGGPATGLESMALVIVHDTRSAGNTPMASSQPF